MFDENKDFELENLSRDDKVRHVMFKNFSSNVFLAIAIVFTITFVITIVNLFTEEFQTINILNLVIPLLMLIGIWKTYNMARGGKVIDTSGIRIVRGVITFTLVILVIVIGLLFFMVLFGGIFVLFVVIPFAILCYAYYTFRMTLSNIIASFEDGNSNTDYYNKTFVFLIISIVITVLTVIVMYTVDFSKIPELQQSIVQQFEALSSSQILLNIINIIVSVTSYVLLAYFVYNLKKDLDQLNEYHGYHDIDYRIADSVIDSDKEIDDRRKYGE